VIAGRILLAEDDDDLRSVIKNVLESEGLEVHEASSGFDLLDTVTRQQRFDLIVSDMRMQWMSGLQIAISLRNAGFDTPLIIMSAFGSPELRGHVASLGNAIFLDKPFESSVLVAAACRALGHPRRT
jgi:CheY-like chemotaxis protein